MGYIWGKMKTIARERAPQTALRKSSKEMGQGLYICDFSEVGVHAMKNTHVHARTHTHTHIYILQKVSARHKEQSL